MNDFLSGTVTPRDWVFSIGIVGLAAVVAAVFYIFVHQSQMEELSAIQAKDEIVVADLDKAQQIAARIDDLRSNMRKTEALVAQFEERLPSRHELPTLLTKFEQMAYDEGLDIELSSLSRSRDERKETIPYRIIARGQFHQIMSFINSLERFERYLKITDLQIHPVEFDRSNEVEFTMNTYRFLADDESG